MITMSHKCCKKVMIVNAKISKNSYGRWKFFKNFRHKIFDSIDICYTQSKIDEYKLINLGIQNSIYLGNIKFDALSNSIDEQLKEKFQKIIKNKKVILCSLIHLEEIEIIIKLYKRLQNIHKNFPFKKTDVYVKVAEVIPAERVAELKTAELAEEAKEILLKSFETMP